MGKRAYRPVSESYLTEYLGITYPPGTWRTSVNLGVPEIPEHLRATPAEQRMIKRSFSGTADAVVFLPNEVHIIEAKVRDDRGKIEQLQLYEWLFRRDKAFAQYRDRPIRKILLTPKDQGFLEQFMRELGIEVVYYRPPWIEEYIGSLRPKERRGTLSSVRF